MAPANLPQDVEGLSQVPTQTLPTLPYQGAMPAALKSSAKDGRCKEYVKEFGFLSSFCSSFGLMAYITGITGTFSLGFSDGGPVMVWSNWILTAVMNLAVALSLAEISSAMPVAGGPYHWCLELTDNNPRAAIVGWITGWLNVLGQFATTAFAADILVSHIASMWVLGNGHVFTNVEMLLAYAVILVAAACLSSVSTRGAKWHALFSGAFLLVAGVGVSIALLVVAPTLQPASWAIGLYDTTDKASSGLPSLAYMYLIGMLMGQATFIGYEAPAQFAEETRRAARNVPWAMVTSVIATALCGGLHIASLLFSVQDVAAWENSSGNGSLVGQVYHDVFQARFGVGTGGIVLMLVPAITTFNCIAISLSTNARVLRALARDRGVFLWRVFMALSDYTGTPVNAVWAMAALAFLLGLPLLYSTTVFSAIASISSVGLYVSYGIPILLRICKGRDFCHGPFSLGQWYLPLGIIAISWVIVSTVAFMLPVAYPITYSNFNYAPITVVVAVAVVSLAWYLPKHGAKHAFLANRRGDYDSPYDRTLLSGRHSRKSIDGLRAVSGRGSTDKRPVGGDGNCHTKLTLLDLITDHSVESAALPPGAHMTRRSMRPEPPKKIQARGSGSGGSEMEAARKTGYSNPLSDPGSHPRGDGVSAYAEQIPLHTRGGGRPPQAPLSRLTPG